MHKVASVERSYFIHGLLAPTLKIGCNYIIIAVLNQRFPFLDSKSDCIIAVAIIYLFLIF